MKRGPVLLCSMLFLTGCSHSQRSADPMPVAPDWTQSQPLIEVRNDHGLAVRLFVVRDGRRYFVGEIPAATTRLYEIPRGIADAFGRVRLLADPVGAAEEHLTEPVEVGRAGRLHWRLKRNLLNSRPYVM